MRKAKILGSSSALPSNGAIQTEHHRTSRIGWLRAAVLGANDGLLSTASLVVGVASANATHQSVLVTGVSGLVAGAMSMAAGEFVSVSSQADTEKADLKVELNELESNPTGERNELAGLYVKRGLDPILAKEVAKQLMRYDALDAHARDELGISSVSQSRPLEAALRVTIPLFTEIPISAGVTREFQPNSLLTSSWI